MGSLVVLGVICLVLALAALYTGGSDKLLSGTNEALQLLASVAPQLALGFLMAGLASVLIPQSAIASLVGADSGLRGLFIATAAGALTPGGPFLQFPLVAALLRGGAGEGPVVAYLTAWSLLGLNRVLVWELPVMGPAFTTVRWVTSLLIPIGVGLVVPVLLRTTRPS